MHNIVLFSRTLLVPRRLNILNEEETCRKHSVKGVMWHGVYWLIVLQVIGSQDVVLPYDDQQPPMISI